MMSHLKALSAVLLWISLLFYSCAGNLSSPQTGSPVEEKSIVEDPQGAALILDYPRLGMWWPLVSEQSIEDIARYDWVILGDEPEAIDDLRVINPEIIILNSTNACELTYSPVPGAPDWANKARDIPAEWFLTQVGTKLTRSVDMNETIFYLENLSISAGDETVTIFEKGDTAVIEGESVLVTAVDRDNRIITVQRGYARPASVHEKGTRIAAHITFWPGSWLLNLSTLSTKGTIDPEIGEEWWGDYNARVGAQLLENPGWDGILVDRSDPDESYLLGYPSIRSIDPDQSNTLVTDYSEFDRTWNDGMRRYEEILRNALGPEKIIFSNWGIANYDLLNGNNFEGFPQDDTSSYGASWRETVFGPSRNGSYFQWMDNALQPNITMIETYEDDGGPDPSGGLDYVNPGERPGFTPDYRKMRFGLATALLNDGFFSYEINTNGHGYLGLLWFDEYDNAGEGKGYLGQPLGPAYRLIKKNMGRDLLENRNASVILSVEDGSSAEIVQDSTDDVSHVAVLRATGTDWHVSSIYSPVSIRQDKEYSLTFEGRSDSNRTISAWLQQNHSPWTSYLQFGDEIELTPYWQNFELSAVSDEVGGRAGLFFGLGRSNGDIWLKEVQIHQGSREVWRRDFTGGIVLLNASNASIRLELEDSFQRIDGTQDRKVNNGAEVTILTLPSHDGLILLRP